MLVTCTALVWTILMWALPSYIVVPMPALSAAAMALFATKLEKTLLLYPPKVRSGLKGALMGFGGRAVADPYRGQSGVVGAADGGQALHAYAKMRESGAVQPGFARRLAGETVLLIGLLAAMVSMGFDRGFEDPAVSLWMVMLGVQSLPYAATFITATISALSNKSQLSVPVAKPVLSKAA